MKKLLLMLGACMAMSAAQAQYYYVPNRGYNPGGLNTDAEYPVGGGLAAGWTTLFTGSSANISAPAWSPVATIPFAFNFNGAAVTDYKVSTSGILTFSTSGTAAPADGTNATLPNASIPDKSVLVWGLYPNTIVSGGNSYPSRIITKTFGTAPNRQHWVQFNTFFPGTAANSGFSFWSIVLEETTNKIYIVDQRSAGALSLTAGIQINSTTAFQVTGSPNLNSLGNSNANASDNTVYEFFYGTRPAYDLETMTLNLAKKQALSRAPFTIAGTLRSLGATTVNSFNLNYKIGNNPTVTSNITNVNIPTNGNYKFTHPTTWNPSAVGTYAVKVWASNINGNADLRPANDTTYLTVSVEQSPRTVVHEVFTSATCPPCLPGNANLKRINEANPGLAIDIKYQQNFPAPGDDPYQTTESIARRSYYNVNSIPNMRPDGGVNFATPADWNSTTSAFNANGYSEQLLNKYSNIPANILIDGEYHINPTDSTVTARATIRPFANVNSTNLVLHSVITERQTVNNFRTNGETEFYDVMKKMMPNENGLPISALVNGQTVKYTNSFAMNEANYTKVYTKFASKPNRVEHLDSLRVVFFVQDRVTKEVFNAGMGVRVSQPLGVSKDLEAAPVLSIYPNPTNGNVNVYYTPKAGVDASVSVYNIVGKQIFAQKLNSAEGHFDIDLSGEASGVYILNMKYGNQVITKKISLVK